MNWEHEAQREQEDSAAAPVTAPGRRSLIASRYPTLAQALGDHGGEPTIHDAATAAVEHKDSGAAVDASVAARVGAHLGADFSGVRVHSDPLAQQATAAMGARAFAYGSDVFLGPGESGADVHLMAHELTHVAQQGAAGQRTPQRAVQVGDADSPAEREADQVAADVTGGQGRSAALLVDDSPVGPGQMLKSQFLEQLRAEVTAAADAELGPIYSAIGCPYIEQYFGRYANQPASAGEALLRRFAPTTRSARAAADMIPAVVARVREGARAWRETGAAPVDLAAMAPDNSAAAAAGPAQAQALRAPDGSETLASLEAELGPGQPLDGATASRMSDALGIDVSSARIHTGSVAARKAADAGALAFAVGPNVVMGASAPAAGTLEGDAVLAHELAHTAQQASAAADPVARRQPIGAESSGAEDHADEAAASALAQLHGGTRGGFVRRLGGALKTGLQLQRCAGAQRVVDPQMQLAARVTLQRLATLAEPEFRREVGAMSRQETEDLLNNVASEDRATHGALISRIKAERVLANAEQLEGRLHWSGPSGPDSSGQINTRRGSNEFAIWVRGGREPTDTSGMNCWEMVLYAGWRSGVVAKAWIVEIHERATADITASRAEATAYHDALKSSLNFGAAAAISAGPVPRGNLVFFNGIEHVAISTGTVLGNGQHEVMSLWSIPSHNYATQRTTIEVLRAGTIAAGLGTPTIRHAPPPW